MKQDAKYTFMKSVLVLALLVLFLSTAGNAARADTLTLPAALQTIESEAFFGDTSLDEVILPEGIRTIGANAFAESSLRMIHLPASLEFIASSAFAGCDEIHAEVYEGSYAQMVCEERNIPYRVIYPVISVTLNKTNTEMKRGEMETLTVAVEPENATNPAVTWTSSNPSVAAVSGQGVVTALSAGTTEIKVTTEDGGLTDTCQVTVVVPATGLTLNKTETVIYVNRTETLTAMVEPEDATNQAVTWLSSNPNVASVSTDGKVEALSAGTAVITATTVDGGFTATCTVKVDIPVSSVLLNKTSETIYVYKNKDGTVTTYSDSVVALKAAIEPANATDQRVTWTSSNEAVATVDDQGVVTAVSKGTAIIRATSANGGKTAGCTVTVKNGVLRFLTQPVDIAVERNKTAIFTVEAALADEFVWQRSANNGTNWTNFAFGKTEGRTNTLTLTGTDENASFLYRCRAADENGYMIYSDRVRLTVTEIPVAGITLNGLVQSEVTLNLSDHRTESVQWSITPSDATLTDLTWSSSNENVVTVQNTKTTDVTGSNGITAVGGGTAIVTARADNGVVATCTVTVNNSVSLNPATVTGGVPGGASYNVAVTADGPWTVKSDSSWLTLNPASGTGNGTVQVATAKNATGAARTAKITVTCGTVAATYTLTQNAYSLTLNPTEQKSVSENGATYTVSVMADGPWTVASEAGWLTVSPASGTGNGTITVTAAKNTEPSSRAGNIAVNCGGVVKKYRLHQKAYYYISLDKTSGTFDRPDGSIAAITLTANAAWTAQSDSSWLTVSPASGSSGSTKLSIGFTTNTTTAERTGKITITCGTATATYTLKQGKHTISLSITAATGGIADGGSGPFSVTSNDAWTAKSDSAWLTFSPTTGNKGTTKVTVTYAKNTTTGARTGKITFTCGTATIVYSLTQNRHAVNLSDGTTSGTALTKTGVSADGASYTLTVTPSSGCSWTAKSDSSWLTLNATSGSGNGSFKATAAKNNTTAARTATVTVTCGTAKATFIVTQDPYLKVTGGTKANGIVCRTIYVNAAAAWTATTSDDWLTLNTVVDSSTAKKTISGNAGNGVKCYAWLTPLPTSIASRTGYIVFKCGSTSYTLNIVQARTDAPMTGVSFTPTSGTWNVGETKKLTATFSPTYATDRRVTWISSNTSVATVDANGNVKGIAAGTAKITVKTTDGGYTAVYTVTIKVPPTGVTLNKTSTTLNVGATETLTATVTPSNATNKAVTWSSSNNGIATVTSAGVVKGVSAGTATITVTTNDGGKKATCSVTVKVPPTGITLNKTSTTLNVGATETLTATVAPSNATNKAVTWASSDNGIATVTSAGVVKGVSAGTATITVATNDGGKKATCSVTVRTPFSPAFDNLNDSNYAITYLYNHYSHYAYFANTLTGTKVEVMPSTELKLYAVGTNSNGDNYAKIVYNGQTLYIEMWKVTGNGMGAAWKATSSFTTYKYPGGGTAGSVDSDDTVYTLQENDGWRQVMYPISGGNWKIAWYQISTGGSDVISSTGLRGFMEIAEAQIGVKGNEYGSSYNNRYSVHTGTVGSAWCAPMVAYCASKAGINCISHSYTYADPWRLCTNGKVYVFKNGDRLKNNSEYASYYNSSRTDLSYYGRWSAFTPQEGDLIFFRWEWAELEEGPIYNFDHVEIVKSGSPLKTINPSGSSAGSVYWETSFKESEIIAVARPNY